MSGQISKIGFVASMLSVVLSLYIYFITEDQNLGIFVGLWAPTLILATKEIEEMLKNKSWVFDPQGHMNGSSNEGLVSWVIVYPA